MIKLSTLLLIICFSSLANASTKTIDVSIPAMRRSESVDRFFDSILHVYVDDDGDYYITGQGAAKSVSTCLKRETLEPLVAALKKSIDWSAKSRSAGLNASKKLIDLPTAHFTFFSANNGKQTDVILEYKDMNNKFIKLQVYLNPVSVQLLIVSLGKVDETLEMLKKEDESGVNILK